MRGVDTTAAVLPFRKKDTNLPNAGRLIVALRQIGYSFEQAISDLVDNSVNAQAKNVLIRFLHDDSAIQGIAIVDDGDGMDEEELNNAMRFGSDEASDIGSLGKFGMGLKLASLSHAQSLTVYSRKNGSSCGRRWTLGGVKKGWYCERLDPAIAGEVFDRKWGPLDLSLNGTLVLWEKLDKLPTHKRGLKYTLTSLENRLRLHLGLCFHRFLTRKEIRICIDQLLSHRIGQGLYGEITPLDPFGYESSANPDYPKTLSANLSDIGQLGLIAHIWPPNNESSEYRLGRRSATRQGFYFYRNERLIQAGGWNGLFQDETEPHSSLARVCVDLPTEYDEDFGINVQKSTVLVPPVFGEVLHAEAADGTTFEDYRRSAVEAYRSANAKHADVGRYPSRGLKKKIRPVIQTLYSRSSDTGGFEIRSAKLKRDEFFRLDAEGQRILVNSRYIDTDSKEVVKLLLSLLFRNDLKDLKQARKREIEAINRMLIEISK